MRFEDVIYFISEILKGSYTLQLILKVKNPLFSVHSLSQGPI